jgi:N-acetylmuramoyl-L-alanine amidase
VGKEENRIMKTKQKILMTHLLFILVISFLSVHSSVSAENVDKVITQEEIKSPTSLESVTEQRTFQLKEEVEEKTVVKEIPIEELSIPHCPEFTYSKDWDAEDEYLLAKIAMAESEGESIRGKELVILVVLNRVWSDEFPDTIEEVILQENDGVYQFSPVIPGGRWWTTEPNEDCWEAVDNIKNALYDFSDGALYFEASKVEDNWHSRNLTFLYQEGNHRFYK